MTHIIKPALYNAAEYGARGIARPGESLEITKTHHPLWHDFALGFKALIWHPTAGEEYDSVGIQRAIDAAADNGGGTVVVPPGDYLIGPLVLRSGINLHLEGGARLWGSPHLKDYEGARLEDFPIPEKAWRQGSLISASHAENVSITGSGQINAQAPKWMIPWYNEDSSDTGTLARPAYAVVFRNCRRVRVEGVRLLDSPSWSLVFCRCSQVQVRGIELRNHMDSMNGDGIDVVESSDVTISDSNIHCADDGIVFKSFSPEGAVRNVAVTNCVIRTLCNGIKIGTETVGTFEDITCSNLVINNQPDDIRSAGRGAWSGINLNTMDGGLVRNINISNIVMRNVESAFFLLVGRREKLQKPHREVRTGCMERISFSNLVVDGCRYTAYAAGFPGHPIRHLHLSDIHIHKTADFYAKKPERPVGDHPDEYPHPYRFGSRKDGDQLPAYGLYLRHVESAAMRDFHVECDQPDARDFLTREHCKDVRIAGM